VPGVRLTYIKARHRGLLILIAPNLKLLAFLLRGRRIQMFALAQGKPSRSPLKSMLAWCRARFKRTSESDFGCCDEAEIERMARDIRMSASELRALARKGPKAADLLLRRMAALDLDHKEVAWLEPAATRDLQRVCTLCKSHRRCAWDFARRAPPSTWKSYCPNTGTLEALNGMPWTARSEW
jgi:hypothetical protein